MAPLGDAPLQALGLSQELVKMHVPRGIQLGWSAFQSFDLQDSTGKIPLPQHLEGEKETGERTGPELTLLLGPGPSFTIAHSVRASAQIHLKAQEEPT